MYTAIVRWLTAAMKDGRLKPLNVDIASEQIHSLIKGSSFWPQLLQTSPILSAAQRHDLAERTVTMVLSTYQA
ncbi:TetR/AcrR family transcriptional regulator C-terminal domain-containing protein [Zhongshania aliphaticivorans]|uniref:TetR/AcrR family transcriptional regulator C-terminal domain-containing protein n=1 Tax=Zhongshania aliphaticivorans TaxID=1470434 RepID=UPI002285E39A|nr:TetR/AcrR family transcriptional regulator C-terminal domain-containing protein [Zhongshania aliphaticivorans]